jgi:hypothetical protein
VDYARIFELVDRRLQKDFCPEHNDFLHPEEYNWIVIDYYPYFITNGQYNITFIKILKRNPDAPLSAMDTAVLFHELGHHVWLVEHGKLADRTQMQSNRWLIMKEEWGAWLNGLQELKKLWHNARLELTLTALWMAVLTPYCLWRYLWSLYIDGIDKYTFPL